MSSLLGSRLGTETIDFLQTESGSIANSRLAIDGGPDADAIIANVAVSTTLDVLAGFRMKSTTCKR